MSAGRTLTFVVVTLCLALAGCSTAPTPQLVEVTRLVPVMVTATEPQAATATAPLESTAKPEQPSTEMPKVTETAQPTSAPTATAAPSLAVPTVKPPEGQTGVVTSVVDGDTFEVEIGGQLFDVQYLGANAPELNENCGAEATAANTALVEGQTVTLVKDVSERDEHARLLRYVYVGGVHVNAELVAGGWARAVLNLPDGEHYAAFLQLETEARNAVLGCHAAGSFTDGQFVAPTPTAKPTRAA